VANGGDLEVRVVGPGQLSLSPRSLFSLNSTLWGVALVGAFLAGMALQQRLSGERPQPMHPPSRPKMPANALPALPNVEPD
jgi:hypothetical protein